MERCHNGEIARRLPGTFSNFLRLRGEVVVIRGEDAPRGEDGVVLFKPLEKVDPATQQHRAQLSRLREISELSRLDVLGLMRCQQVCGDPIRRTNRGGSGFMSLLKKRVELRQQRLRFVLIREELVGLFG